MLQKDGGGIFWLALIPMIISLACIFQSPWSLQEMAIKCVGVLIFFFFLRPVYVFLGFAKYEAPTLHIT